MWGTSSPDDKLVTDLAKATEAIKIAARRSDRLMAGKLSPLNFGLLQQNRHTSGISDTLANVCSSGSTRLNFGHSSWAVHDPKPSLATRICWPAQHGLKM